MKKTTIRMLLYILISMSGSFAMGQGKLPISGFVKDEAGNPLQGVSYAIKGGKIAGATDAQGFFKITVPSNEATLVFTYVGYLPKEMVVGNQTTIAIVMSADAKNLNEVVVTGFGVKKESRKVSYAVQTVKGDDLVRANSANIVNALQGKVAGVMVNQGASGPQSSSRIRIRGNSSINTNGAQSTQPLFVIDGILVKPGTTGADSWGGNQDFGNIMKDLNSDDYESVSVLKGAAATALYGSDALNGVILITTKKGRARKGLGVSFSHTESFDKAYKLYDRQTEYGAGINPTFEKDGNGVEMVDPDYGPYYSFGPKLDGRTVKDLDGRMVKWVANDPLDFFQTGKYLNTNVAVEGGSDRTTFRFSYSNLFNNSVLPRNSLNRNNFALRATQKISDFLNIDVSVNYASSAILNPGFQGSANNPLFQFSYYMPASVDLDYWRNNYVDTSIGGRKQGAANPYHISSFMWTIYEQTIKRKENTLLANVDLNGKINSWLNFLVRANINTYNDNTESKVLGDGAGYAGGSYGFSQTSYKSMRVQGLLIGSKQLGQDFSLNVSAGGETNRDLGGFYNNTYTNGGLKIPGQFTIGNSVNAIGSDANVVPKRRLDALYAYGDLTWKNMLTLNFSARNDWASTLTYADGTGNYTYFYPSVGLAYIFTETPGFKKADWLSFGKLRVSYGFSGRDYVPYLLNRTGQYNLNGNVDIPGGARLPIYSFADAELGNKNVKPELAKEFEIGTELRFLNNRIGLDFTYYSKIISNQILDLSVPFTSGVSAQLVNSGKLENKGIEIILNAVPVKSKNFNWTTLFNFSRNTNKILELAPGVDTKVLELAFGADVQAVARVNQDYGTIVTTYGYAYYQKVDANGKPVDNPSNGLKVIGQPAYGSNGYTFLRSGQYANSQSPEKVLGTMMEKFLLSNINTFNYKEFSLGFQVDSKIGGLMASATHQYGSAGGSFTNSLFGRDAAHGGIEYVDDQGVTHNDGIIPDGVFADGITANYNGQVIDLGGMSWQEAYDKGYMKPKPAWAYYEDLSQWSSGIREYSVFENSWVALREVSVGYNLPAKFTRRIKFNSLRVSLVGRNLGYLYKTAKDGINPEGIYTNRQAGFAEYGGWPYVRSLGFSINASF